MRFHQGWLRLWIVLIAVWSLGAFVANYLTWPQPTAWVKWDVVSSPQCAPAQEPACLEAVRNANIEQAEARRSAAIRSRLLLSVIPIVVLTILLLGIPWASAGFGQEAAREPSASPETPWNFPEDTGADAATTAAGTNADMQKRRVEVAKEILRQGEEFLKAQLQSGLGADQRAIRTASAAATIAVAAFAGAFAVLNHDKGDAALVAGGVAAGLTAMLGACLCARACLPVSFHFYGSYPRNWILPGILSGTGLATAILAQAQNVQGDIDANERALARNAKDMRGGMYATIATPLVGAAIWILWKAGAAVVCVGAVG